MFDGSLRAYPRWSRQWKHAQQVFGEDHFFLMLNNATPSWLDVLSNSSLTEAWEQLDARFANTQVVAQAPLKDYKAFIPKAKGKNERLIKVAEHVNLIYTDLVSVDKGAEMDQTDHLILMVLDWLDIHHRDELVNLYSKDETAPKARQVGIFKILQSLQKESRSPLLQQEQHRDSTQWARSPP